MKRTIVKNKGKQIFYSIFLVVVLFSFLFDKIVHDIFLKNHNPFFDFIFKFFSDVTVIVLFILLIVIVMLKIKKDNRYVPAFFASIFSTFVVTYYLKFFVARARPGGIELITYFNMVDYSFPSAHTALIFCMIPILDKSFSHHKKLWVFLGVMVGLSRLYLRVHYFSDVLFGAFLGLLIGELLLYLEKKYGWSTRVAKKLWN
jgi:undecaprenyl-diphosphatase